MAAGGFLAGKTLSLLVCMISRFRQRLRYLRIMAAGRASSTTQSWAGRLAVGGLRGPDCVHQPGRPEAVIRFDSQCFYLLARGCLGGACLPAIRNTTAKCEHFALERARIGYVRQKYLTGFTAMDAYGPKSVQQAMNDESGFEPSGIEPLARISVSLPRSLYRQFRLHALDQDTTLSALMARLIRQEISGST